MGIFKQHMLGLKRWQKTAILICMDMFMLAFALWLAFYVRLGGQNLHEQWVRLPLYSIVCICAVLSFHLLGTYRNLLRAINIRVLNSLAIGCGLAAIMIAVYGYFNINAFIPRSIPILFAIIAIAFTGCNRIMGRWMYRSLVGINQKTQPIVIYGAGEAGTHVAAALENSTEFKMIGFLDDDLSLTGNHLCGKKIHSVSDLETLCKQYNELRVLICIANISTNQKLHIIGKLQTYPVKVLTAPTLPDIVAGHSSPKIFTELKVEELLGRKQIPPISKLFEEAVANKTILVTGGGGSIGSELCQQLITNKAKKLIIVDNSEYALYRLEQKLEATIDSSSFNVSIEFRLASVTDRQAMNHLFHTFKPQLVYHAAAHKHVPLLEQNVIEGLKNNVLGTQIVAKAAAGSGVERFILISTDKAVRPTNVLGATKRVAELLIQALSQTRTETIFTMVRFGNVLGSSGSVIPKFKSQIANGGPVTVTHPEISRYFMTRSEAAQLVIQAGSMARGGEVFILDMGDPIRIINLAQLMIQMSGKTIRNAAHPNGDIKIEFTGLRPGEKLHEELLISNRAAKTNHPKIMTAIESATAQGRMQEYLKKIEAVIDKQDANESVKLLQELVHGFKRKSNRAVKIPETIL